MMFSMDSKMYVTGDFHGEKARFYYDKYAYNTDLKEGDYLFECGDFGFLFNGSSQEEKYLDELARKPFTLCFVDGNHENFNKINSYEVEEWNGGKVHVLRRDEEGNPKIIHLMRGQIFVINGVRILAFGGAYSIDQAYRTSGKSWWKEEMPTDDEKKEALNNLSKFNYEVDVILTHTAPESVMSRFYLDHHNEKPLNDFLEYIRESCKFKNWFFGHLHEDEDVKAKFGYSGFEGLYALYFDVRDLVSGELIEKN